MDFWHWFSGMVRVQLTAADIAGSLTRLGQAGIEVFRAETSDDLNACFSVRRADFEKMQRILLLRGDDIKVLEKYGLYWLMGKSMKRPILMAGIVLLIALSLYLPGKILYITVDGNPSVPTRLILEEAEKNGLGFWSDRRQIRSEKIKNALLEAIPQLQWTGVNTSGCVATISVRERQITQEQSEKNTVSSIVAARDGVIWACTATRGNPVCKIGQAVKAGEVLISGYTDCGLMIQATRAEGEVYARTEREISVVCPLVRSQRILLDEQTVKYSLIIGKKRINFYNGSGISDPSCGKMYEEKYLTLPGGFRLPVILAKETWTNYVREETLIPEGSANGILSEFAATYLREQMVAGRILSAAEVLTTSEDVCRLEGKYACLEMIGQVRKEAVYGNND